MGEVGLLINGGVELSVNVCVYECVCVYICLYGCIKVWVSGKMQSRSQQRMCLVIAMHRIARSYVI